MKTKTVSLYTFDELNHDAKERARMWMREVEGADFSDAVQMEPVETAAKLLGIDFDTHAVQLHGGGTRHENNIWWSGFWNAGDGASFDASYSQDTSDLVYLTRVMREFPKDTKLHQIARGLAELQRKYDGKLTAKVKREGREVHKYAMTLDQFEVSDDAEREISEEDEKALLEALREFAQWIYEHLREEYDYQQSDEAIEETIEANEYTFTAEGKRED